MLDKIEFLVFRFFLNRKFKTLANQYELLVEQRQTEINRLTKSLEEKNLAVEQVERINYDEVQMFIFF